MDVAALVTWLLTAGGGFFLFGLWIARGGLRQQDGGSGSHFPPAVIFGHLLLAAAGLVVWIAFLISDESSGLAWTAFVILLPVALLGFVMVFRWLRDRRELAAAATSRPAEQHFPVPVVALHGLLAVTTLVLVLLTAVDAS